MGDTAGPTDDIETITFADAFDGLQQFRGIFSNRL